ncbi:MAG TPA: hypothetical protein VG890_11175 [Puia sp.]|nr:hypothetical protein [Puia sp.]
MDKGWPRQVVRNGNTLVYYQPQVDQWKDYTDITARMAFSLTPKGGRQVLGVANFEANTLVDKDNHQVYLRDLKIPAVHFPSLSEDSANLMKQLFLQLVPKGGDPISLERLMADVEQSKPTAQGVDVKNDPPEIFYSASPAILLTVDGDPVLAPIEKLKLEFVVNTNWDLFFDKSGKKYYLLADKVWLASDSLKGPWKQTTKLPKDMQKLPSGQNFDDVKKMVPPPSPVGSAPQVFFSNKPAELILLNGAPVYTAIQGTQLLYIANTDNDIFLDKATQTFYILLSGRWFKSASFTGPWEYTSADLPKDFAKIPENSKKGRVLSSVPGTEQAADAVLLAQIPTTAIVNRAEAEAKVQVTYNGEPQFKDIETTNLQYATNTDAKVIRDGDLYYLCFQAVWFMSTTPSGPWKVAESVPKEIYSIPPSSPVYNVTYVVQSNPTPETVESSYTAGYLGMFVLGMTVGACIAFGTGWYYPPFMWWGPGMLYPVYRPWPVTYGMGAVYNPWTGGFAAGRVAYGPYGAARSAAWYNPATGRYGRSASVQGWYGGRTAATTYNPWTGGRASTVQGHNAYSQWGSSVASRGNQWVQTGHVTTANGTMAGYRTSNGNAGVITHGANGTAIHTNNGNVYAGHDGNVYKKDAGGGWSQYNRNGGWTPEHNTNTTHGLSSSEHARQRGQMQTQRFQSHNFGGGRGGGFRRR